MRNKPSVVRVFVLMGVAVPASLAVGVSLTDFGREQFGPYAGAAVIDEIGA